MPLQFLNASQQYMQFLDMAACVAAPVGADELEPNHRYIVLLFLQNTDPVDYDNVQLTVWHDNLNAGARGLSSLIVQPHEVDVPACVRDVPGVVMVRFVFMTPSAGRGLLAAKVLPSGPTVMQAVQVGRRTAPHFSDGFLQSTIEAD
jgi:hypothetical protein